MKNLWWSAAAVVALATLGVPAHAQDKTIICPPGTTCIIPNNPPPVQQQQPQQLPYIPPPPPQPPQPVLETWWIYNWVRCYNDVGDCVVTITVDGLNVRDDNEIVRFAVVNGTPVHIVDHNGRWLKITFSCPLVPTGQWSSTANVRMMACR